jgi:glycyl-tRNA synthetase
MDLMDKIISLSKRRGFIFPSSEIYGGFGSSYDFGPLGVELKRNIKESWWEEMTQLHASIVGLDAAILMSPKVWEASGHLTAGFADELVECKKCHKRFRLSELKEKRCPECGGDFTESKQFNLMMKTFVGSTEDESAISYLRAETCQGIYINFKNVLESMRLKLPFGIAQIGKSFRNEITTKNFIFRMREFEQMEMQYFCNPKDADKWFEYWKEERLKWYEELGLNMENLKIYEVPEGDRAHYAKRKKDIMYNFPFGWQEIEGIHNRGDWDLSRHSKFSGVDLSYADQETKEKYIPYIIETSVGVERSLLAFLTDAYSEIEGGRTTTTEAAKEVETLLRFNPKLSPIKVAVLPLLKNKPELIKKAEEVYAILSKEYVCQYDEAGAIGRRYRRQDEIGTPYCTTIDFDSLEQGDVTVRDRDTMEQERIAISDLIKYFRDKIN